MPAEMLGEVWALTGSHQPLCDHPDCSSPWSQLRTLTQGRDGVRVLSAWGNLQHRGVESCLERQGDSREMRGSCLGAGEVTFVEREVQGHSR